MSSDGVTKLDQTLTVTVVYIQNLVLHVKQKWRCNKTRHSQLYCIKKNWENMINFQRKSINSKEKVKWPTNCHSS